MYFLYLYWHVCTLFHVTASWGSVINREAWTGISTTQHLSQHSLKRAGGKSRWNMMKGFMNAKICNYGHIMERLDFHCAISCHFLIAAHDSASLSSRLLMKGRVPRLTPGRVMVGGFPSASTPGGERWRWGVSAQPFSLHSNYVCRGRWHDVRLFVSITPQQASTWRDAKLSFPNPLYNSPPDANGSEHRSSEA